MNSEGWIRPNVCGIEVDGVVKEYSAEVYATVELTPDGTWMACIFNQFVRLRKLTGFELMSLACKAADEFWDKIDEPREVAYYE